MAPTTEAVPVGRAPWAIPAKALNEWQELSAALDEAGTVPCRSSDPEAWWPEKKDMDSSPTREAVCACWRCPAREACLDFALAANEREGVWGGLLPDQRREMRQAAA